MRINLIGLNKDEIYSNILINTELEELPEDMKCHLVETKSWHITEKDVNTMSTQFFMK